MTKLLSIKKTEYTYEHIENSAPIDNEFIELYFDPVLKIGVEKIYIDKDLQLGEVYEFKFGEEYESNAYDYIILKREDNNIYYISQYNGNELYKYTESLLGEKWIKCDIKDTLKIDIDYFEDLLV